MGFVRQTWTLCQKTLMIVFWRHMLGTLIRALIAPIIFMFIISYTKNFFVPPSDFGVGSPRNLRTFSEALQLSSGGRNTFVFVNNGYTGGDISTVINALEQPVRDQGFDVQVIESPNRLLEICPSTIRGVSTCFGAVQFYSSPTEGGTGIWNYTIRADGALGQNIYVNQDDNDPEIYALPLQHAVDSQIAQLNGTTLPDNVQEFPYTTETPEERERNITRLYMNTLIDILGVAYFVGIVGICYQLTGEMAKERELGMSQLIESMMPNRQRWVPQAARLIAMHLAFDILYLPGWIIMGAIVGTLNYVESNIGVSIGYFLLAGLALSSYSVAFASLFRKAQLSGITVTIVSIILAIIIQVVPSITTAGAIVVSLLFPPMNFTLWIIYMAYWQRKTLPAQLSEPAPESPWEMAGWLFYFFCVIQIIVFPLLGAFFERALFGTASKARTMKYGDEAGNETVKISGLAKIYPPNWFYRKIGSKFTNEPRQEVRAVDDVNISVLKGQIMVLLGANGSGKSTTLDMLAGLQKPTSGTIEMDASGGIGLCPQKNVLWDELSVLEHVQIFNRLKATNLDSKETMTELVKACDLEQKVKAHTNTLSGGQKRKCQMAMMLTGGSSLCMLDEVSSGLDPLSRRKIWDIILAERGKRSMILTTHFLDEADLLSDDITILSKGQKVAGGSAVALKAQLGGGYRVRVYHEDAKPLPAEVEKIPKQVLYDQTVYQVPDSGSAAKLIKLLEGSGVQDYQVNGPTIEDVFLKLAEEVKAELQKGEGDRSPSPSSDSPAVGEKGLQLVTGKNTTFFGQTWVLFRKRATILMRNVWPYLVGLLIPIIAAGLVTLFLGGFEALSCAPGDNGSDPEIDGLSSLIDDADIPVGPPADVPTQLLQAVFPFLNSSVIATVDTLQGFIEYVTVNYDSVVPGGFFAGDVPTFAWQGDYGVNFAIAAQNLLDVALTQIPIATAYQPFATPFSPNAGSSLQFILYFGLAMSAYPGFFALYPNRERLHQVRALHYSNGIRAQSVWAAYTLFDFLIVLVVSTIAIIIFTGSAGFWFGPGYMWLVFVLFGLSATLSSYVVSLFTPSQLSTFAFAAGGQCVFFLIYFLGFMATITYAPAPDIDRTLNIITYTLGAFFPAANLLRCLLLTFNSFSILCRDQELVSYAGTWSVYGSCITFLIIQSAILLGVLIAFDSGWKPSFFSRTKQREQDVEEVDDVDKEVYIEAKRVEDSKDELRVMHANKTFGENTAVQDISFGVPKGEVFALLGPNGAGKSTTIGLVRGDTKPTGRQSEVLIEDTSIISKRAAARQHLGVCPQFDAMDQMTAVEHLRFYARARGVPDVEHNVEQVMQAVGLLPFKTRMANKLSGGNKRKLSLGIALIGNPSVVMLDEPSSGMDAASKRVMWRTLTSVSDGRSLVLTTHSMEEADALADRAGIMAKKMLALGTADQLRKKHGDAYHVHLVHKDAPHTSSADMEKIKEFIKTHFPGSETEDRVFHGQLRFSVPNDRNAVDLAQSGSGEKPEASKEEGGGEGFQPSTGISALFSKLEASKEYLGFQYYSVSQATLDQVFLSIVSKHNVQEENYKAEHYKPPTKAQKVGNGIKNVLKVALKF
ncbi:hypothetical protein D0864_05951 [Hortaea werneckii]|uniref:ABC transporter domain-containing protein n=1 Tax=Hortaea werneckii TaxID=91943 RepID=A0A3M7FTP0_HORWE|nr:putative ABC transporter [Hortaea werneckii]KAI7356211.1 putative ABC transporter [Hortaea werneckii]KAI7568921.1 putative ABC transporter [Hortaea werneckii]KAI7622181.1 putative ABC transporter [Hortaea werneckii]RMY92143.1 hypothetical protein D0864_05951 [Hortaea werneckii]